MSRTAPAVLLLLIGVHAAHIEPTSLVAEFGTSRFVGTGRPLLGWKLAFVTPTARAAAAAAHLAANVPGAAATTAPAPHAVQAAFQIQVALDPAALAQGASASSLSASVAASVLWDSGKVLSNDTIAVEYGRGDASVAPLPAATPVYWRVGVWEAAGPADVAAGEPTWSAVAAFETALLAPADWHFDGTDAQWLGMPGAAAPTNSCTLFDGNPAPIFRSEFTLPPSPTAATANPVTGARLHVSGLGYYEVSLNGVRVGEQRLDPGWTRFDKRVFFSSFDVTPLLLKSEPELTEAGDNAEDAPTRHAVGVRLGNGFWNPLPLKFWGAKDLRTGMAIIGQPMFVLQLRVTYADGSQAVAVASDPARWAWQGLAASGTTRNNVYLGERVLGATERALAAFDTPGFTPGSGGSSNSSNATGGWVPAVPAADAANVGPLQAQPQPPITRQAPLSATLMPMPQPAPVPGTLQPGAPDGTVCGAKDEHFDGGTKYTLDLTCSDGDGGAVFDTVHFASWGMQLSPPASGGGAATGWCGAARNPVCDVNASVVAAAVSEYCLGKAACSIPLDQKVLGFADPCPNKGPKRLVVSLGGAGCMSPAPAPAPAKPGSANYTRVLDLGRNFAGSCVFSLPASTAAGRVVSMLYGEILNADGSVNPLTATAGQIKSCPSGTQCPNQPCLAAQTDEYTLAADGAPETFAPRFSWHGFRYVAVTGWPGTGAATAEGLGAAVTCYPLRANVRVVGTFASASQVLNDAHAMGVNTCASNLFSVQSDCPHRERFGYGGDALASGEAFMSHWDMGTFYAKRLADYGDEERVSVSGTAGVFTETAPYVGISAASVAPVGLTGAGPIGWQAYQPAAAAWAARYYGHDRALAAAYNATARFVAVLADATDTKAQAAIESGLGDWMSLESKALPLTGRAWALLSFENFANMSRHVASLAEAGHHSSAGFGTDAASASVFPPASAAPTLRAAAVKYDALALAARKSLNDRFFDATTGAYGPEQTPVPTPAPANAAASVDACNGGGSIGSFAAPAEPAALTACMEDAFAAGRFGSHRAAAASCSARLGADRGRVDSWNASQTAQALPLFIGLPPNATARAAALRVLLATLDANCSTSFKLPPRHLAVGMWGVKWLLMALGEAGRQEYAVDAMTTKTYPGFGYMLAQGATTVWESWFTSPSTYSHNHPMFASHLVWMQQSLGGIQPHPAARAFDRVLVRPRVVDGARLSWVNASFDSARGRIATAWAWGGVNGTTLTTTVELPPNVEAEVHVPSSLPDLRAAGGHGEAVATAALVRLGSFDAEGKAVRLLLGGGTYTFESTLLL